MNTRRSRHLVIEERSIDYVPLAERHGKVWHQAPFWFTGNFVLVTSVTGFVGPGMGLSLRWCLLAIVLGVCFGTFFMAFHANQGPRLGLPQMIQSRAQFGMRGAVLPFTAVLFVYVGFIVFNLVMATQALRLVLPGTKWFWYPVLIALAVVLAIVGHDLLHVVQRWLTYLMVPAFVILTIGSVVNLPGPTPVAAASGWHPSAFLALFSAAAGYQISYAVYVSDYSRYLPADVPAGWVIWWTYLGAALSAIWLMGLGAFLATRFVQPDPITTIRQVGDALFPGFGLAIILISVPALISISAINAYGAMLTSLSAVDGFHHLTDARSRARIVGVVACAAVAVGIALLLPDDWTHSFHVFVLLMLYFLVPWTAVNLVDFYVVRHGHYAVTELFNPDGVYGRWPWRGVVSYLVSLLAMLPFMVLGEWQAPVARLLGGADVAFAVGLLAGGGLYWLLCRNLDRTAEIAALETSRRTLSEAVGRAHDG